MKPPPPGAFDPIRFHSSVFPVPCRPLLTRLLSCAILFLLVPVQDARAQNCDLAGAWEVHALTFTAPDGTVEEVEISDPPGLKVLTDGYWVFVEQNAPDDPAPTSGGGGRYTVTDSTYTETVLYHAARSYVGETLTFDCRVEGNFWVQSGPLPDGTHLSEVYRRLE